MKYIWILLIFASFYTSAQPEGFESAGVRADPEWISAFGTGGFSWPSHMIADKSGNTYITGHFQRYLRHKDKYILEGSSTSKMYLIKHSPRGEIIWVRKSTGKVLPSKMVMDKDGNIFITGKIMGEGNLTGADTTQNLDVNFKSIGIFIAKYDTAGNPSWVKIYSEGKNESANDLAIDKAGNIYLAGFYNYRFRAQSISSYLIMKLDQNGNVQWKHQGDTIDMSIATGIALGKKGKIYVCGTFSGTEVFEDKVLTEDKNNDLFVGCYNADGKLDWLIYSAGNEGNTNATAIALDRKRNIILAGTYTGNLSIPSGKSGPITLSNGRKYGYILNINKKGEANWIQQIESKRDMHISELEVDGNNNIYLIGESADAVFHTTGNTFKSYKARGNNDIFVAKYDNEGKLQWLKSAGAKLTDYGKSFVIHTNGDVTILGSFSGQIQFQDTTIDMRSGYSFFVARFSRTALESETASDVNLPELVKRKSEAYANPANCNCEKPNDRKISFVPTLKRLATYEQFTAAIDVEVMGGKEAYDRLFYIDHFTSHNHGVSHHSFKLIALSPLILTDKENNVKINLTPCHVNKTLIPTSVNMIHRIKKYDPSFDHRNFVPSAENYYNVLLTITGVSEASLMEKVLFEANFVNIKDWLSEIQKQYSLEFDLSSYEEHSYYNGFEFSYNLAEAMTDQKVDVFDLIFKEFISEEDGDTISNKEFNNLYKIFASFLGNFDVDDIYQIVHPQYDVRLSPEDFAVEIDEKILRLWNSIQNIPVAESGETKVLFEKTGTIEYSNLRGFGINHHPVCFPRSEITGTGILIDFSKANFFYNISNDYFNYKRYMQFDSKFNNIEIPDFSRFNGLLVREANIYFPQKEKFVNLQAYDVYINNNIISGVLQIPVIFNEESLFTLKGKDGHAFELDIEQFKNDLETKGMDIYYESNEKILNILFIKKQ